MELVALAKNPVPSGATTGTFKGHDRLNLRFARWEPTRGPRRGTVCLFQGRGEFIEKYFEVVADLRRRGFAVATMDWRGQGGSSRLLSNPRKGHVRSFADFDQDLADFMKEVVLPDCPPPYIAMAHSMGGHILLRNATHAELVVLAHGAVRADDRHRPRSGSARRCRSRASMRRLSAGIGLGSLYVRGRQRAADRTRALRGQPADHGSRPLRAQPRRHRSRAVAGARLADRRVAAGGAALHAPAGGAGLPGAASRCRCCCLRPAWTASCRRPRSRSSRCA